MTSARIPDQPSLSVAQARERRSAVVELALRQHGLVHRSSLDALGFSRSRVRGLLAESFLRPLSRDVFVVGAAPDTWHQRLAHGVLRLGPGALAAGEAAAALHHFDTFKPGPLCFLVPTEHRGRAAGRARVRASWAALDGRDVARVDAVPCTSPARTIFDLASSVSVRRLEHAIDSALRDRSATEEQLVEVLARLRQRGRAGVRRLEAALAVAGGPPAHSVLERRYLRLVAAAGLPVPGSQVVFVDERGSFVARVDFLFEGEVIVEVEGYRFHATRAQRAHDNRRRNELTRAGKVVVVFTYDDVRDRPAYVVRETQAAVRWATRRPSA